MKSLIAFLLFVLIVVVVFISGCSTAPPTKSNYDTYGELLTKQQAAESNVIASIAATASACLDARCVEHVAALAAIAATGGRGGGQQIAPPLREVSGAEAFAAVFSSMSPFLATVVTGAVQWQQSNNSVRQAEAQYEYLGDVIGSAITGMSDVARNATPSINVAGNYGDTYGADYTGGDRTDAAGPLIYGDGNAVGDRNFNGGRQDSPGPFEEPCTGEDCATDPAGGF